MLTPFGKDLVSIIRGYFLVGEVDKLMNFIIKPIGYTDGQLKEFIRKSTWGYEVKVTNISWEEDNSFILTVRTTIQNTSGSETYQGKIINDTAKLNLFPDSPRLFVK
jgi:diacylglycerol kinase family enzyme